MKFELNNKIGQRVPDEDVDRANCIQTKKGNVKISTLIDYQMPHHKPHTAVRYFAMEPHKQHTSSSCSWACPVMFKVWRIHDSCDEWKAIGCEYYVRAEEVGWFWYSTDFSDGTDLHRCKVKGWRKSKNEGAWRPTSFPRSTLSRDIYSTKIDMIGNISVIIRRGWRRLAVV